jgi:hypothetical protein
VKKVHFAGYAIGALGVAPALGLMVPTGNAVAAVTHTPGKTGKTVSLLHSRIPRVDTCGQGHSAHAFSPNGNMKGVVYYSGECMHETEGILDRSRAGLSMRTRLYSDGGGRVYSHRTGGSELGGATYFFQVVDRTAGKACEALVSQGPSHKEIYGAPCETI